MDIVTRYVDWSRGADWALDPTGLVAGDDLESAVLLSLFTDARANDSRGWWANGVLDTDTDELGSTLWTLAREKQTTASLRHAEHAARVALAWLVNDGLARALTVVADYPRTGVLRLTITLMRPTGALTYRIDMAWRHHAL